jgi:pimeloyl-ACP methyl ester carboxylesterase
MPVATTDGLRTRYQVSGSGPPLLMYSPAGFDAVLEKWTTQGTYAKTRILDRLQERFTCILFDRRECGESGGRVEALTWSHYAAQGKALLDHLNIERAHIMGGCMGVCPTLTFARDYPASVNGLILWWPVGGPRYRIAARRRFHEHLDFVASNGLNGVVAHVLETRKPFSTDASGGPWASVILRERQFARSYAQIDLDSYSALVSQVAGTLFDRDTVPGAEPEELFVIPCPTLIVPGHDATHATSAARYLEECLPNSLYWNVPVEDQTKESVADIVTEFSGRLGR